MICDAGLLDNCELNNVLESVFNNRRRNERIQSKTVDQAIKHRSGTREPSTSSYLGFQLVHKTPTIHVRMHTTSLHRV
jgi:hypothetical protein